MTKLDISNITYRGLCCVECMIIAPDMDRAFSHMPEHDKTPKWVAVKYKFDTEGIMHIQDMAA